MLVLIPIDLKFELISKFEYFNLNRRIAIVKLNQLKYSNESPYYSSLVSRIGNDYFPEHKLQVLAQYFDLSAEV